MAIWFFLLLPFFMVGESHPTNAINQTDQQAAMANMRTRSSHGFAILLNILNTMPNSLQNTDLTFFMPNDEELSKFSIPPDHLRDFILGHSIPTPLVLNHLSHFLNGSVLPSSIPSKMISITDSGRLGLFVSNARITKPKVFQGTLIRCHGISATLTFENMAPILPAPDLKNPQKNNNEPKPASSVKQMSTPPFQ